MSANTNLYKTLEDGSVDLAEELAGVGLGLGDDDESVVVQDVTLEVLRGTRLHRTLLLASSGLGALNQKNHILQ